MESLILGTQLLLEITDLARSGAGVGRAADGRVVFVPFTAPGDRVRAQIVQIDKRYAEADLIELIEPSSLRAQPPCPVFGRCGGCQWQHIPYKIQWQTKFKGVLHALSRVQIELPAAQIMELPAEKVWNYRNRIQLRGEGDEIGYFAARSHDRVAIERCEIARPELNAMIPHARDEGKKREGAYKVELEVLPDGSTRSVWNSAHAAQGFRQVHDEQNEKLRGWVREAVSPGRHVYDLFGGSGNLSTAVAGRALNVDCVDVSAPQGMRLPDFPQIRFHRSPVLSWTFRESRKTQKQGLSSAILDPPREGLANDQGKIATSLEKLGVTEIVAVGCDVDSWARDVSRFLKRGWKLERIAVLDLFPQTPHVESLAKLAVL